jgi:hypothetical protein
MNTVIYDAVKTSSNDNYNVNTWTKVEQPIGPIWQEYRFKDKNASYLRKDNSVEIPAEVCQKLNWNYGSWLWIEIYDEKLSQIIVGKKLSGQEASIALERLGEIIEDNQSA